MKNHYYLLFLSLFLIFQCKEEVKSEKETVVKPVTESFKFEEQKFYGVYQLNENDFAICIPVQMGNGDQSEVDSLSIVYENFILKDSIPWIYRRDMGKYAYYDTLHVNQLIYNEDFESLIRKRFKKSFTIFGIEGKMNCAIKKIVFQSSECGNDYIALILNLNKDQLKNPVIASEKDFNIQFGNDAAADKMIKNIGGKEATENLYGAEKYEPKTFAKIDDYYFSYDDDFKWFSKKYEGGKKFPERLIAKIDKDKFDVVWANELDLLGLPCL